MYVSVVIDKNKSIHVIEFEQLNAWMQLNPLGTVLVIRTPLIGDIHGLN